jgi:hypothetical protein
LIGEIETIRASREATPAKETEKVPPAEGRILKVAMRPSDVPTKKTFEE